MRYDEVQQSLEEYVVANWKDGADPRTAIQFQNVQFNADMYHEYLRLDVVFGEGLSRAVTKGCLRQMGLLLLSILTKPGIGSDRKLVLAKMAADMVTQVVVSSTLPLDAPKINLKVPSLFNDNKEHVGWVMAQVSCPFYYDLEI